MKKPWILWILAICCVTAHAKTLTDRDIAANLQPSFVQVEYTLKFDQTDAPEIPGWGERCPNCGRIHSYGDGSEVVMEERPLETTGYMIDNDRVLSADLMIHPRFIEKIAVRFRNQSVAAAITDYLSDQPGCILKLEKSLEGTKPLTFSKTKDKAFKVVSRSQMNTRWITNVSKMQTTYTLFDDAEYLAIASGGIIVDSKGKPVAISMDDRLPLDNNWQRSPLEWDTISAKAMQNTLSQFESSLNKSLLRVKLMLRSPKKNSQSRFSFEDDEETATEMDVLGIVISDAQIMIMANLSPKTTARLEKVLVFTEDGKTVNAGFTGTLADYGAFIATLETPLEKSSVTFASDPISDFEKQLLLSAEIRIQGDNRTVYLNRSRIADLKISWRKQLEPGLSIPAENRYLFDLEGRLLAIPLSRRKKVTTEQDRWMYDYDQTLIAGSYIQPVLASLNDHIDIDNIPLSEAQENRIAWLGIEMQQLNEELARINKVSNLTENGHTGAMVSYIYDNSPAKQQGLEMGDILLQIHIPDQPRPLPVQLYDEFSYYGQQFPWDFYDQLTEDYFDELPTPWPPIENDLIRALTDLGFGKKFEIELFRNGEVMKKRFMVTQSPPYYASAKRYESKPIGMTVRNITYEVSRYYRIRPEDPGIIISKVKPGSKASVSGIKPYEIITHVSDQPVNSVDDFQRLTKDGGQLKLSIKRMTKGRVVNLDIKPDETEISQDAPETVNLEMIKM